MMKGLIIALALTMTAPLVFASNGSHSSRSERYELCYVDGSAACFNQTCATHSVVSALYNRLSSWIERDHAIAWSLCF